MMEIMSSYSRFCFRWIEYDPVWVPKILELMEAVDLGKPIRDVENLS
jgi:hypothetical protein